MAAAGPAAVAAAARDDTPVAPFGGETSASASGDGLKLIFLDIDGGERLPRTDRRRPSAGARAPAMSERPFRTP